MKTTETKNVGTPYVINGKPVPALEYAAHCKSIVEGLKPERERYYLAMQAPGISDEEHDDLVAEYFEADATIKECIADIAKITGEEIVDEAPMGKWWNTKPEIDTAKITFDRVVKARRHHIGHVTTKQGRHMWYIYGRLVSKKEITEWLADEGFTVEEYIAAEKVADKYEEEVEFPRRMAIREQAEFLRDKIDADRKASVEPMPALYPAEDSSDDELIDPPVEPDISKEHIGDSLTRAMKTALEKFQGFCLVKNLTAAENELKLYNICRLATRELWR